MYCPGARYLQARPDKGADGANGTAGAESERLVFVGRSAAGELDYRNDDLFLFFTRHVPLGISPLRRPSRSTPRLPLTHQPSIYLLPTTHIHRYINQDIGRHQGMYTGVTGQTREGGTWQGVSLCILTYQGKVLMTYIHGCKCNVVRAFMAAL